MKNLMLTLTGILLCGQSMALTCPAVQPTIPERQLYVIAGQSNAAGLASVDDYTAGPKDFVQQNTNYSNVKVYGIHGYHAWLDGKDGGAQSKQYNVNWAAYAAWNTARPGFGFKNTEGLPVAVVAKRFGPELAFASLLQQQPPYDHYIVKLAVADTPLAWHASKDHWAPGGRLYKQLLTMIENAYQSKKNTVRLRVAGLFFMQGETDALSSAAATQYQANLNGFIAHFRNAVHTGGCTDNPQVPVVIGRIQDNPAWTYRQQVRWAQQEVDKNSASVGLVNTDDFAAELTDAVHYNEYGQFHLGLRMYFSFFVPQPQGNFQFPIQKKNSASTVMEQFYTQGVMGGAYCCKSAHTNDGGFVMNYLQTHNHFAGVCSGWECSSEYALGW